MLEISAVIALVLLSAREYLAVNPAAGSQRAATIAGLSALPFLLVFAAVFASRVLGYLGAGA